jgi:predicted MFS family arabinose efflux permease
MRTTPASLPTPSSGTVGWRGVTRGFVVLWKDGPLRLTFLGALVLAAIYLPSESVILPTYFEARNEPGSLGLVIAALAGGSTVGSFAYGWISARMNTPTMLRLMMVGTALSIIPMALLPPLPVLLTAGFFLGLFWGPLNPLMTTLVQKRVSPEEQGRVFGVQLSVWYAAPPLGMVVVGYSVETLGISTTYLALATLLAATALAILFSRSVRQLDA